VGGIKTTRHMHAIETKLSPRVKLEGPGQGIGEERGVSIVYPFI
jgi:hypothetical protein